MSSQRTRRRTPYPWTWELPAAVAAAAVAVLVVGVQLGRAAANLMAGGGWRLPPLAGWSSSTVGILAGNPAAGLTPAPAQLATAGAVGLWVAVTELLLLSATTVAGVWLNRRWGPSRMVGMASRSEAEQTLGISQLRKNRTVIRPDLYPGRRP